MILDFNALPFVPLSDRRRLPSAPGVYFVRDDRGFLYYIGRSKSIASRWCSHEKVSVFEGLTQKADFFIHYLVTDDHERIEKESIQSLFPLLNQRLQNAPRTISFDSKNGSHPVELSIEALFQSLKQEQDAEFSPTHLGVAQQSIIGQPTIFGTIEPLKGQFLPFAPSKYQQAIFDWVKHGTGDAIVTAVAGSGKTTTLIEAVKLLDDPSSCRFFAFNKSIRDELKKRLPKGFLSSTFHSLGYQSCSDFFKHLGDLKFSKSKYHEIIKNLKDCEFQYRGIVLDLCNKARTQAIGLDLSVADVLRVAQRFRIDIPSDKILLSVVECIQQGIEQFMADRIVDFADQIWLPVALNLPVPKSKFIMVDECQDLNPTQLQLLLRSRGDGRALWVGDASQSIYLFAGAASDSINQIKHATNAVILPLSISYRCARSIVQKAQEFDDAIEPSSTAPMGTVVEESSWINVADMLRPGDLVVCRKSMPLAHCCMQAIVAGKHARMVGEEDLKKGLLETLNKILSGRTIKEFEQAADAFSPKESRDREKIEILIAIYRKRQPKSIDEFTKSIKSIFTEGSPKIRFSTIHKAKGLEADRVFVLEWKSWNVPTPLSEEERQQEKNLRYVAVTRAKSELYLCG